MSAPWISVAEHFTGITETRGAVDNPQILEMYRLCGYGWVKDDETPWCAAFVGACLALSGYKNTGKLNARSYLNFGQRLDKPRKGCIAVFWRGNRNGAFGHVAFFEREEDDSIIVLGGNQGEGNTEAVNTKSYPKSRLLGYVWPVEIAALPDNTSLPNILQIAPDDAPSHVTGASGDGAALDEDEIFDDLGDFADTESFEDLQMGSEGALVRALQTALVSLNYPVGGIDGEYGPLTRDAVLSFQANNDLPTTGIADMATIQALTNGKPKTLSPGRLTTTEADLQAKKSRIINSAGWNKWLGIGTGLLGLFGISDKHLGIVEGVANGIKVATGVSSGAIPKERILQATENALTSALQTENASPETLKNAAIEAVRNLALTGDAAAGQTGGGVSVVGSVVDLAQSLLSSGSFGPWGMLAAAGFFIWRNARNVSTARVDDHVRGRHLGT